MPAKITAAVGPLSIILKDLCRPVKRVNAVENDLVHSLEGSLACDIQATAARMTEITLRSELEPIVCKCWDRSGSPCSHSLRPGLAMV